MSILQSTFPGEIELISRNVSLLLSDDGRPRDVNYIFCILPRVVLMNMEKYSRIKIRTDMLAVIVALWKRM